MVTATARVLGTVAVAILVQLACRWSSAGVFGMVVLAAFGGLLSAQLVLPIVERCCARVDIVVSASRLPPVSISAALWVGSTLRAGTQPQVVAWSVLATFAVWAGWIDTYTHRIPNALSRISALVVLVSLAGAAAVTGEPVALVRAVSAAVIGFGGLFAVAVLTRGGLGMGDVWFFAPLALVTGYLGWERVGAALVAALLLMFPVAWWRVALGRTQGYLAAGPFLIAGTAVALTNSAILAAATAGVALAGGLTGVALMIVRLVRGRGARGRPSHTPEPARHSTIEERHGSIERTTT